MYLQTGDGPRVVVSALYALLNSLSLSVAGSQDHNLAARQNGANTNGQSGLGNLINVAIEETSVSDDRILGQGLDTGTRVERRERLVERDVTVVTYATHKQVDTACCLDLSLVLSALTLQILSVTVQNVYILGVDVNVLEEVVPHKRVVALGVLLGQVAVLVHIERDHVLERNLTSLVHCDQLLVSTQGSTTGRKTQNEGLGTLVCIDSLNNVICCPLSNFGSVVFDN